MATIALQLELTPQLFHTLQETATKQQRSINELAIMAIQTYLAHLTQLDPLFGALATESQLVDDVMASIMEERKTMAWRLPISDEENIT